AGGRCRGGGGGVRAGAGPGSGPASAGARPPPAGMRARVLAAIARPRQLPPQVDRRPADRPRPGRVVWFAGAVATAGVAAAVTLAFVLAHTMGQLDRTTSQLDRARSQAAALAAVLAAPDARARTATIPVGGPVTARG